MNGTTGSINKYKNSDTKIKEVSGKVKTPLNQKEYEKIIEMLCTGFMYKQNGKKKNFLSNKKVALALALMANCDLGIGDIIQLKVECFKNEEVAFYDKKTDKVKYIQVNNILSKIVFEYATLNNLELNDYIINCTTRNIQNCLKVVVDELGLENVSTFSFKRMPHMDIYNETKNLLLLQTLIKHSNIIFDNRNRLIEQARIDEVSASIDFTNVIPEFTAVNRKDKE